MNAQFRAIYLPALAKFVTTKDVRYYLAGILIEPAPAHIGGVYLIATDGHTACLIHDPEGFSDGIYITETPHKLASRCMPHKGNDAMLYGDKMLSFDGVTASISDKAGVICSERCKPIVNNGKPPVEWRKALLPRMPMREPVPFASTVINIEYLGLCSKALRAMGEGIKKCGYAGCEIFPAQSNGKFVLVPKTLDKHRIMFAVMPMRNNGYPEELNWLSGLDERWQDPEQPWIEWTGLKADREAISDGAEVEVQLHSGITTKARAIDLNWGLSGLPTDIARYRIIKVAV